MGYVLSKVRTSLTEPFTKDASAVPIATNHPDKIEATNKTDVKVDKRITAINPPTGPDNPAHSLSFDVLEVTTTKGPTDHAIELDVATPSIQTPDAKSDDNLPQNIASPLLTSKFEDPDEQ